MIVDRGEVKIRALVASRGLSKGEDEPLVCGNKITSNWSDLFNFLNPSPVSFVLYLYDSTVVHE